MSGAADELTAGPRAALRWSDRHAHCCGFCAAIARWIQRRRNARMMEDGASIAREALAAGAFGLLGRLLYWANNPKRPPLGWHTLWEGIIAFAGGYLGLGVAEFCGFGSGAASAAMIAGGFLGPRLVEQLLVVLERRLEKL